AFSPAQAQGAGSNGNWLEIRPACQALTSSKPAISIAFRWSLGLALVHDPYLRCICGERINREGDHSQRCLVGGQHITWHHALRGAAASLFHLVAIVQEERYANTIGPVHPPDDANLRMDIVADDCHTRSSTIYFMADMCKVSSKR
ncbi:unnamed protein product, partial [Heterosigma akashiwo]